MKKDDLLKLLDVVRTREDQDNLVSIIDLGGQDVLKNILKSFPELDNLKIKEGFDLPELRSLILKKQEVMVYTPVKLSKELVTLLFEALNTSKRRVILNCIVDSDLTAGLKLVYGGRIYDFTFDRFLINRTRS